MSAWTYAHFLSFSAAGFVKDKIGCLGFFSSWKSFAVARNSFPGVGASEGTSFTKWASQVVLVVKNPPANAGDIKSRGFDPWVGKIPW